MIKWILKACNSDNHKEPFIVQNAKYHCFIGNDKKDSKFINIGKSLCGKYEQNINYDTEIRERNNHFYNKNLCKKCFQQYEKIKKH